MDPARGDLKGLAPVEWTEDEEGTQPETASLHGRFNQIFPQNLNTHVLWGCQIFQSHGCSSWSTPPLPIPPTPGAPSGVAADHRVEAQEIRQRPSAGERFQAPEEAQRGQRWRPALRLLARAEQRAPADGILSV